MTDKVKVIYESKEFFIPAAIANDDKSVRKLLAISVPEAANASIERKKEDGVETITIVKKSAPLG